MWVSIGQVRSVYVLKLRRAPRRSTTTTTPLSSALATGIRVDSGVNNLLISNSGSINVDAITENGGEATAYGIRVVANGVTTPGVDDVTTIENSGDIIVRVSTDGGTTFHRGTAIDVTRGSEPVGDQPDGLSGNIYGNIELQSDADTINVTGGETLVQRRHQLVVSAGGRGCGGNRRRCRRQPGAELVRRRHHEHQQRRQLPPPDRSGRRPVLCVHGHARPARSGGGGAGDQLAGTITFDLPGAVAGEVPVGTYPQVFVDNAYLDGTLVAHLAPGTLFDTTVYQNVIDANVRTGTFDQCVIGGIPAGLAAARLRLRLRQPEQCRPGADPGSVRRGPWPQQQRAPRSARASSASST